MKIKKIAAVYFSPTENAKKIATFLALYVQKKLAVPIEYVDFTLPEQRLATREFSSDELVIFAVPVYAGRVPNKILPFVQTLFIGNRTPAIPIVTYGNRSFDNALKELCMELDQKGFLAVGAGAFVSEHAFSDKLATNRPNEEDMITLEDFADAIAKKLDMQNVFLAIDMIPGEYPLERYYTPLGVDGKPAVFLKAKPKTDAERCDRCGICANSCPMGSISKEDYSVVEGICIKCQACVQTCPEEAKYFDDEAFLSHVKMLEEHYSRRTESAMFV